MEPRIQYALRPDRARTAYAVFGSGPILVIPPGGVSHIEWYIIFDFDHGSSVHQRVLTKRANAKSPVHNGAVA